MALTAMAKLATWFVLAVGLVQGLSASPLSVSVADGPFLLSSERQDVVNYRLNEEVLPNFYDITLTPNLDDWTFGGHVIIHVEATVANLREITLHANDLTIESIRVYQPNLALIDLHEGLQHSYQNATHKLTIPTNNIVEMGRIYYVDITYTGNMRDDMAGFYRSVYMEGNVEKRLGSTQFQTTSARRAFPCFDEPKFKANFQLKFLRTAQYQTISNTKRTTTGELQSSGLYLDVYEVTPKMSTYLIAFIVSEYTNRASEVFGVWARPGMYAETQYAYDVGIKLLDYLNDYTDYSYFDVMAKMDMAAIPDFSAGAMENWGLLTYRESNLLYRADKTTALTKQRIAAVISHEQAHMWFGDLVTCDWWKYTWLNEGFARYHQYFTTGKVETTWDLDYQFVVEQLQGVFQMDSSNSTRAMNHDVNTPSEVSGVFDNISYNKGASIIRMIEHLMGPDNFLEGIRQYLKDKAFGSAVPTDLYARLQLKAPVGINIPSIMSSWTDSTGYPVLKVEINSARNLATLSQRRFLMLNPSHTDDQIYQIPLTYTTPNKGFLDTTHSAVLGRKDGQLAIENGQSWVIFNVQQVGYYRVNYDEASWHLIHHALLNDNFDGIHVLNRAQIVDDVLNLARGGEMDYQLAFDILDYIQKETNYIPWLSAFNGLAYISRRMAGAHNAIFGEYINMILEDVYKHVGFMPTSNELHPTAYNRANVLQWLCKYDHEDCINNAKAEFEKARTATYVVPVDIRQVVYCTGMRFGDTATYNWLWNRYLNEDMATEQVLILNALGCIDDDQILNQHLGNIFSTALRKQDKSAAFSATYAYHDRNIDRIFSYIKANHASIVADLGSYGSLASYISGIAVRFTSAEQVADLNAFADTSTTQFGASVSTLRSAVANAQWELHWDSKYLSAIAAVVDDKVNGGAGAMCLSMLLIAFGVLVNFLFKF